MAEDLVIFAKAKENKYGTSWNRLVNGFATVYYDMDKNNVNNIFCDLTYYCLYLPKKI